MNDVALATAPTPTSAVSMPDITVDVRATFGIDSDLHVPAFSVRTEHVPDIDPTYKFDRDTTLAILAGFAYNRRVMVQGYHGTAELDLHPRQPGQPHQPHRPDRQGRHRVEGWQADHRIPRGHSAVGAAARLRAGVRRV
jgi:hypothetical protein